MNHAIIIHGWGANSASNWFPWLKAELEKKGWQISCPDFPHTQIPQLEEWLEYFDEVLAGFSRAYQKNPQRVQLHLIGHSLGVPFILRWLEHCHSEGVKTTEEFIIDSIDSSLLQADQNNTCKISSAYLVSGFHKPLAFSELLNFVNKQFDWEKIKKACKKFTVINSDNDPYIPREIGKELADKLGVKELIEHNAEHINAPGGYLEYPRLLKLILS